MSVSRDVTCMHACLLLLRQEMHPCQALKERIETFFLENIWGGSCGGYISNVLVYVGHSNSHASNLQINDKDP